MVQIHTHTHTLKRTHTYLSITTLVDKLTHRLEVGVTIGDIGFDPAEEVDGAAVELDEDAVLDLAEAEELQDLLHLFFFFGRGVCACVYV